MALTPEDVVNKRFQPTKFREGYDQDEVDDFLDEVVVELRRLTQENDELKQRLVAADARIAELQHGGGAATGEQPVQPAEQAVPEPVAAVPAPPAEPEPAAAAETTEDETTSTNNLLQLARRLHEEHVREGAQKRDALIAEGHATAARVVAEAEAKQRAQISALEEERSGLQRRIDELRDFERDYRAKLRSYIEGQLHDLDSTGVSNSTGSFATPVPASGESGGSGTGSVDQPPTFQGFGS